MTITRSMLMVMMAMLLLALASIPSLARAEGDDEVPTGTPTTGELQTVDKNGKIMKCSDVETAKSGKLIGKIVPCMVYTISTAAEKFTTQMVEMLMPLFYAFLSLTLVFFGIRILTGEPEIHKQGLILLIKIAVIGLVYESLPGFVSSAYDIMNETQTIIVGSLQTTDLGCNLDDYGVSGGTQPVWALMDCILGKLFGFMTGQGGGTNMLLASSLFGLMSGFLFGGTWGITIFFLLIGVLASVLMLVVRIVVAFLNGYFTICLMLMITPLLLPLTLMRVTQPYFEGVWKNILAAFIMPAMIAAYSMLALMIYDELLFRLPSADGQKKGAIIQELFKYDKIKDALEGPTQMISCPVTNNPESARFSEKATEAQLNQYNASPWVKGMALPMLVGANDPCAWLKKNGFNLKAVDSPEFKKGKETYNTMFTQLATLVILSWMIHNGLSQLMNLIRMLSGAGAAVTSMGASSLLENKIFSAGKQAEQAMKNVYYGEKGKEAYGADFLKKSPDAVKKGIETFILGVKRK